MKKRKYLFLIILIISSLLLSHYLTVYKEDILNITGSIIITTRSIIDSKVTAQTFSISISAGNPVSVAINSPINITYNENETIELNLDVDVTEGQTIDTIYYTIDNGANNLYTDKVYINVSEGSHILSIFANDTLGIINNTESISFVFNLSSGYEIDYGNEYNGETTEFSNYNKSEQENLTDIILENPETGRIAFLEGINITGVNLSQYTNISFNRIELDSDALPNFNVSATLTIHDLTFTNPRPVKDGVVCPSSICTEISYTGGTFVFEVTGFSVYSSEETGSPGGGGVGGAPSATGRAGKEAKEIVIEKIPTFLLSENLLKVQIKKGDIYKKTVTIKNQGKEPIEINLQHQQDILKNLISITEPILTLSPGEEKKIEFVINSGPGIAPGVYVGNILVNSGKAGQIIQTVIEIESLRVLFDISLDIPLDYKELLPGQNLVLQATVFNIAGLTKKELLIEYMIKDSKGNLVLKEEEPVFIEEQALLSKTFTLPKNIQPGEYIAIAIVHYQDSIGTSTQKFIVQEKKPLTTKPLYYALVGVILLVLGIIFMITLEHRKLKNIEKLQSTRLKELISKSTQLTPDGYKRRLEKELELIEKSYKSGYITKPVYERGKAKIENLLKD